MQRLLKFFIAFKHLFEMNELYEYISSSSIKTMTKYEMFMCLKWL